MKGKIGSDAFELWVSLGPGRSHASVAEHYGVSKQAVTKCAVRERWMERLAAIEQEAREKSDRKIGETLEQMRSRHLQLLKAMGHRIAVALRDHPLSNAMQAVRAADVMIRLERLVAGDASERTELTVEQVTRQEITRLLAADGPETEESEDAGDEEEESVPADADEDGAEPEDAENDW